MPVVEDRNSSKLLEMLWSGWKRVRQAMPVVAENPPIPDGQASVMVKFVGWQSAMRLKLMPEFAWVSRSIQNVRRLRVVRLSFRVLLSCFPRWRRYRRGPMK